MKGETAKKDYLSKVRARAEATAKAIASAPHSEKLREQGKALIKKRRANTDRKIAS